MSKYKLRATLYFISPADRNAAASYALQSGSIEGFPNDYLSPTNDTAGAASLTFAITYAPAEGEVPSANRDAVHDYFVGIKAQCSKGMLEKISVNFDLGGVDELECEPESWEAANANG